MATYRMADVLIGSTPAVMVKDSSAFRTDGMLGPISGIPYTIRDLAQEKLILMRGS